MNSNTQSVRQFSLIFDDIYNEKHKIFSDKISKWHQDKQQFFNSSYIKNIIDLLQQIEQDHKKFQKRIHELLKVANGEFQIFSKVKALNQEKDTVKSNTNLIVVQSSLSSALSTDESQMFQSIISRVHKKASDIYELSEFASRFFAITSTQLNEFKSLTSQIQNLKQRYLFDLKKETIEDNRILHELCLKSESKYFQLRNFEKLREILQKQLRILQKSNEDVRQYYKVSLQKRKQILTNCIDNMTRYEELSTRIFSDNIMGEIRTFFIKLVEEQLNILIQKNDSKQKQYSNIRQEIQRQYQRIYDENLDMFYFILEDIAMGEWRNVGFEAVKKSSFSSFNPIHMKSHHQIKEDSTHYDDSNKQFDFNIVHANGNSSHKTAPPPSSSLGHIEQQSSSQLGMILTLTMDYKLIFRRGQQKSKIHKQYLMNELRLKQEKDKKKVIDQRKLTLKQKSSKQTIQILFVDADKREQFMLHWQRFEQLKNSLTGK